MRHEATLLANVRLDRRESWYLLHGDWFAGGCLAATVVLAAVGIAGRKLRTIPLKGRCGNLEYQPK